MVDVPPGVVARHGAQNALPVLVSPELDQEKNTVRAAIIPFACWRVEDMRFNFDSSFVLPDVGPEIDALGKLVQQSQKDGKNPLASVFGHADPTGSDDYNKALSGRRAKAVYALLTRNTGLWEKLYSQPKGGDSWDRAGAVASMLGKLGYGSDDDEKKRFQSENGLAVDGIIGPASRATLFEKYMDALSSFSMDPKDFLGQGSDPDGKADYQGCSDFNPQLVFSSDENQQLQQSENHPDRDGQNAANRRVVVFLFRAGTRIDPKRWPCPKADEGTAGCEKRFWSDGDKRRGNQDARREFKDTKDTFACRFYHRLADSSPCEGVIPVVRVRLYDETGAFIANAPYRITLGGEKRAGVASATGDVAERFQDVPDTATLEWGPPDPDKPGAPKDDAELPFSTTLNLLTDPHGDGDDLTKQRLANLGYTYPNDDLNVTAFQTLFKGNFSLQVTGKLDDDTRHAIRIVHNKCSDDLHQTQAST